MRKLVTMFTLFFIFKSWSSDLSRKSVLIVYALDSFFFTLIRGIVDAYPKHITGAARNPWARWGCSSGEAATGRRSGEEVEKRVPGSPAGYHPQLESPALWIRQTGLDHYSMVTNYFKIATYYCKSEFKEIYVCQL